MNPRPADRRIGLVGHHRKTERPKEPVLGGLHVAEEIRVMDNAGHVGLVEFHGADRLEFVGHGEFANYDLRFAISNAPSVSRGRKETCWKTRAIFSAIRPEPKYRRALLRPDSPRARSLSGSNSKPSTVSASDFMSP